MKEKIIKLIKESELHHIDWQEDIIEQITDKYAKGFLTCMIYHTDYEERTKDSELFRENFIEWCEYDIWDK